MSEFIMTGVLVAGMILLMLVGFPLLFKLVDKILHHLDRA